MMVAAHMGDWWGNDYSAAPHLHRPAPRFSRHISWLPQAFDSILAKAMAKNPDNRYESCAQFISLIARALRS